jgi:hypothetical protein
MPSHSAFFGLGIYRTLFLLSLSLSLIVCKSSIVSTFLPGFFFPIFFLGCFVLGGASARYCNDYYDNLACPSIHSWKAKLLEFKGNDACDDDGVRRE